MAKIEVNKQIMKSLTHRRHSYRMEFDEESESAYLVNRYGDILSRNETLEVISALMNFVETVDDSEIEEHNHQPMQFIDYNWVQFDRTIRERKRKQGYVFLYKEMASNSYRFGETKDIKTRALALINSSPVALDMVFSIYSEDTVALKEFLMAIFLHRKVENNWYALTDEDVQFIREKSFWNDYQEKWQQLEDQHPNEEFTCASCFAHIMDETKGSYYKCKHCEQMYCSEDCVIDHYYKARHHHRLRNG